MAQPPTEVGGGPGGAVQRHRLGRQPQQPRQTPPQPAPAAGVSLPPVPGQRLTPAAFRRGEGRLRIRRIDQRAQPVAGAIEQRPAQRCL
ncbi:MAG: hypothetical protein RLZZ219_304 [Cyanobacteriota bacterium]|jgi:hypothetical protein